MLTSAPTTLRCYEEAHQSLYPMTAEQSPTSIHVAGGHEGLRSALVDLHPVTRL